MHIAVKVSASSQLVLPFTGGAVQGLHVSQANEKGKLAMLEEQTEEF